MSTRRVIFLPADYFTDPPKEDQMDERLYQLPAENVITAIASGAQLDFLLTDQDQLAVALCFADHLGSNYRVLLDIPQCEMIYAGLKSLSDMTPDQLAGAIDALKAAYEAGENL